MWERRDKARRLQRWYTQVPGRPHGVGGLDPYRLHAVGDRLLLQGAYDASLFDRKTGALLWEIAQDRSFHSAAGEGRFFYLRQLDLQGIADLLAVSLVDPTQTWTGAGESSSFAQLHVGGGAVVAYYPRKVAAWDAKTGEPLWQHERPIGSSLEDVAATPRRLYLREWPESRRLGFDAYSGKEVVVVAERWPHQTWGWGQGGRLYVHVTGTPTGTGGANEPRWVGALAVPPEPE